MLDIANEYYKELFGAEDRSNIRLMENFFLPEKRATLEENDMLGSIFFPRRRKKLCLVLM
jgi:hypothetical protein